MTAEAGPGPLVLLVEDDDATRIALRRDLLARHYRVDDVPDGTLAIARWDAGRPDVVLLDLGLPDMDGSHLIRRFRRDAATPILVLSARDAEPTKVEALELGADDYVTKPFGLPELHARLRALLRRAAGPASDPEGRVAMGPLVLDTVRHEVTVGGSSVDLTPARVRGPPGPADARRAARDPWSAAPRGLGRGLPRRGPLRPRLRQPGSPQACRRGSRRKPAGPHRHRAGRRLPGSRGLIDRIPEGPLRRPEVPESGLPLGGGA